MSLFLILSERKHTLLGLLLLVLRLYRGGGSSEVLTGSSRPIVLGLGKSVTQSVLVLGPVLAEIGSSLCVKFGVIFENTGLVDISLVIVGLSLDLLFTDFIVLLQGQSVWNIGFSGLDLTESQLVIGIVLCV